MNSEPWFSYLLGVITAAYREFEPRAQALTAGRGAKAELCQIVRSVEHQRYILTFADALRRAAPGVSRRVHTSGSP